MTQTYLQSWQLQLACKRHLVIQIYFNSGSKMVALGQGLDVVVVLEEVV